MAALGGEVLDGGLAALGVGDDVVEVAILRWDSVTSWAITTRWTSMDASRPRR